MAVIPCKVAWVFHAAFVVVAVSLFLFGTTASLHAQGGSLETIRKDVQEGPPPVSSPSPSPSPPQQSPTPRHSYDGTDNTATDDPTFGLLVGGAAVVGGTLTAPIWLPIKLSDDDYSQPAYLPRYPYEEPSRPPERLFAARFDADYVDAFDNLDRINGHLLISTASRFEFDARFQHLDERLAEGGKDQLWTGDCNVTYRFAQSKCAQFRTGLGINWLNAPTQTDLGFNFTYGADIFPARPWVLSAVMDAGTLGHAGLFRFRTTVGVIYQRVELFSGYEYTDIGRVHWNGLIGGVRLWF